MPYPQNLQTALEVEEVVRQHGATPATIAIIAGQPCIGEGASNYPAQSAELLLGPTPAASSLVPGRCGSANQQAQLVQATAPPHTRPPVPPLPLCAGCDRQQLEHIARKGLSVRKVSRRDMPLVVGSGLDGATTVSGTMLLAARAGIKVFVTGGIGGVHR